MEPLLEDLILQEYIDSVQRNSKNHREHYEAAVEDAREFLRDKLRVPLSGKQEELAWLIHDYDRDK